jgi:hypothetical protein
MTLDEVARLALSWPEVEQGASQGTSYGMPALKVRKKLLTQRGSAAA